MAAQNSVSQLTVVHDELDDVFLLHQELLFARRFDDAAVVLLAFRTLLELHMEHEERWLLPILERGPAPRYPSRVYTGEHEKMSALVRIAEELTAELAARPSATPRQVIAVLDRERTLKDLSEHHDETERRSLYPIVDERSTEAERTELLARCFAEMDACRDRITPMLDAAREQLRK